MNPISMYVAEIMMYMYIRRTWLCFIKFELVKTCQETNVMKFEST